MKRFVLVLTLSLLSGCSRESDVEGFVPATVVYFEEAEPGIEPYPVRMIVTAKWMRIDNGNDDDDFLVFDRSAGRISSINREDKNVFLIAPENAEIPEADRPRIEEKQYDVSDMPSMNGVKPTHKSISVNGQLCRDTVAVKGLLTDVLLASKEYLTVLALQQYHLLDKTPEDLRDPCMLANLIYWPVEHLAHGFPIRESDYRGFVRELSDFESTQVPPRLFDIPDGLQEVSIR